MPRTLVSIDPKGQRYQPCPINMLGAWNGCVRRLNRPHRTSSSTLYLVVALCSQVLQIGFSACPASIDCKVLRSLQLKLIVAGTVSWTVSKQQAIPVNILKDTFDMWIRTSWKQETLSVWNIMRILVSTSPLCGAFSHKWQDHSEADVKADYQDGYAKGEICKGWRTSFQG